MPNQRPSSTQTLPTPQARGPDHTGVHQHQTNCNQNQGVAGGSNNLKKKANLNIATLNLNGFASPTNEMSGLEKWEAINRTLNKHKIAILAVQETHLDRDRLQMLQERFDHKMEILFSPHPTAPTSTAGVAFVINKTLVKPGTYKASPMIEGRAIALKLKWHESVETTLINVYAPNDKAEHPAFWNNVKLAQLSLGLRCPDFLLGDFNLVEDPINRAPSHDDNAPAVEALRELRHRNELEDTWRKTNPKERAFTYRANANRQQIQSRIDRIYVARRREKRTQEWRTEPTLVPTDHWMTAVKFAPIGTPTIGKGRWLWKPWLMKNNKLIKQIIEKGKALEEKLNMNQRNHLREDSNPQTLWTQFKTEVMNKAKMTKKKAWRGRNGRKKWLQKDLKEIANDPNLDKDEKIRTNEAMMANELAHLEKMEGKNNKDLYGAITATHGEKLGGVWSMRNKENKPRDILLKLEIPNTFPKKYENNTKRMAKLARDYHKNLQTKDINPQENKEDYKEELNLLLQEIPWSQRLSPEQASAYVWKIEESNVSEALR